MHHETPTHRVIHDIKKERTRQLICEKWSLEHDDTHDSGELAAAASCYALPEQDRTFFNSGEPEFWPWAPEWWKPSDRRRELVKAAALIVAEIERLDRLNE